MPLVEVAPRSYTFLSVSLNLLFIAWRLRTGVRYAYVTYDSRLFRECPEICYRPV